jgi:hypothetical protein
LLQEFKKRILFRFSLFIWNAALKNIAQVLFQSKLGAKKFAILGKFGLSVEVARSSKKFAYGGQRARTGQNLPKPAGQKLGARQELVSTNYS